MISVKFIGTGGAFDAHLGNSSALIKVNGKSYLIDCGHTIYPTLVKNNLLATYEKLLITHLHDDHCGSLSTLAYHHYYILGEKLELLVPTEDFRRTIISFLSYSMGDATKFINIDKIRTEEGVGFIDTTGDHVEGMPSYAYYFTTHKETIVFSGDLGRLDNYAGRLNEIHHVSKVFQDISFYTGQEAHAYYKEVENLLGEYDVYGYHCNHLQAPDDLKLKLVANFPGLLI